MAEDLVMVKEATPKKVAFVSKPYSQEERIKKDEEELANLIKEQKDVKETGEAKDSDNDEAEPDSAEERSFKKRYGDLRKHQQQQQKNLETKVDELQKQLEQTTKKEIKLPKSEEELDEWAKEYPDVAAIVESIAMKKAKEQSTNLESRMKEYEDLRVEATKEKAEAELMQIHPDFDSIRDSDEFHEWAEQQPKWVQEALYDNSADAKSAARAIDLYKIDKNITTKKSKSSDKEAAKAVNTRAEKTKPTTDSSGLSIKESDVQSMSAQEYEKKADVIMEAIRSGKFIYDISGSAR